MTQLRLSLDFVIKCFPEVSFWGIFMKNMLLCNSLPLRKDS